MASPGYRVANPDDSLLEKVRAFISTVEENVDIYSQPLKPHLPTIGRFLIVATFLEDALRILTQWGAQILYLQG
jgi:ER-derived vesicles protein